ncbi:hypothetical protein [Cohnella sp. GbtcB17]|uniref:hypothetical protein n=1 Tax=Cohnella sp. GbtcB17 TaxID=2824762 RepID=UPI001C2F5EB5|nr:hypothetical protein [Cohnella sp. GbtcB17]
MGKAIAFLMTAFFVGFILLFITVFIAVPLVNNHTASTIKKELIRLPLPENTERIDAVSAAGKFVGNGNGMQFFGAMLMKSDLSLEALNAYYSRYRQDEWSCIVEPQRDSKIRVTDRGDLSFKKIPPEETLSSHYIVYTWGSSDFALSDLDMRGH